MPDDAPTQLDPTLPPGSVLARLQQTDAGDTVVVRLRGAPVDAAAQRLLGRYPVVGALGAGGMGEVVEAIDPDLGRRIAAKVMLGGGEGRVLRRFVQEAQITGQLDHPNIVPVYELGLAAERVYFTMKRVRGRDLLAVIAEERTAADEPWRRLLPVLIKVCDAIEFAHAHGVIHRDLKPANVMVGAFGEVLVCDWGLATMTNDERRMTNRGDGSADPLHTQDGTVLGTPAYMPPEQARGEIERIDERADIYSLGAMLYEMLALCPPYSGLPASAVLALVSQQAPDPPSRLREGVPWELERVVQRAMAREREDRYPTVAEFRQDIERFLAGQAVLAARYTVRQLLRKWVARHRGAVAAAAALLAVVLLATVIAFVLVLEQKRRAERERRLAQERKAEFDRLADVQHLRDLTARAQALWPRRPGRIAEYRAWIEQAQALLARGEEHAAFVRRLQSIPKLEPAQQVLRSALQQHASELERLSGPRPHGDTIAGVQARLAFAQELERLALDDRAAWARAIEAIRRSPRYGGLVVRRVQGLVPLGPDPTSGLWEFAHRGTGRPPARGADGRLQLFDDSALVLVLLPAGRFQMGADRQTGPNRDPHANASEQPVHEVRLDAFYLSKYEMTQGQWRRATGDSPSQYAAGQQFGPQRATLRNPVTDVEWNRCTTVLRRLGLELPAEAQWEYAARAGTHTIWPSGDRLADLQGAANLADKTAKQYAPAWAVFEPALDDGHVVHAPVGSFAPNRWGLHDMTGNVMEWCRDGYGPYGAVPPRPGDGLRHDPASQAMRVYRGGSFNQVPVFARCAARDGNGPALQISVVGLRPALHPVR